MNDKEKLIAEVQLVHGLEAAQSLREIKDDDELVFRICRAALSQEFVREKLEIQKSIKNMR